MSPAPWHGDFLRILFGAAVGHRILSVIVTGINVTVFPGFLLSLVALVVFLACHMSCMVEGAPRGGVAAAEMIYRMRRRRIYNMTPCNDVLTVCNILCPRDSHRAHVVARDCCAKCTCNANRSDAHQRFCVSQFLSPILQGHHCDRSPTIFQHRHPKVSQERKGHTNLREIAGTALVCQEHSAGHTGVYRPVSQVLPVAY